MDLRFNLIFKLTEQKKLMTFHILSKNEYLLKFNPDRAFIICTFRKICVHIKICYKFYSTIHNVYIHP